jgi:AAA family ATP:ADP antiporter
MQLINRIFNLRPGDFKRGLPLFGYYFLIISAYMMARVARSALFLDQFEAVKLPYADVAIAALVGFIVAFYIRAGRRASLRNLQLGSLLFFAANILAFWWGFQFRRVEWLSPVFYVWVGIFGVLAVTQVWTLANFVWTTREAKRLFGILGSGGIGGGIAGGFLANLIASTFGTETILLFTAAFLFGSAALVLVIWKQRSGVPDEKPEERATEEGPKNFIESFQLVRKSPHLQAIAGLICVGSIVTTAAGWQFLAIAKETLIQKDAIAAYVGAFYGYTGIFALIVQLVITGKLLRRFGVGVALLVLPLSLAMGSIAVLTLGSLWAATLLKGSDQVFRYSVDTSALQLLYLPVPGNLKLQVKSFLDTVVWRFGDGLAGLTLLVFATHLRFTPRQISWVNLLLLAMWCVAALIARRQYVATLKENIQSIRIRPAAVAVPVLDEFATMMFAEKLRSEDPNEIMYALDLIEMGQRPRVYKAIRNLLQHPSPHIRRRAIAVLESAGDADARHQVAALLKDDNLEVRTEALLYLTRHDDMDPLSYIEQLGDFADFSIRSATVSFFTRPGANQNLDAARMIVTAMVSEEGESGRQSRIEAARLIASLPDHFEDQLAVLMQDKRADVLGETVKAIGSIRNIGFVPVLIKHLGNPAVASDAADALALFGDVIVETLRDRLDDPNVAIEIRREIPDTLRRIGTAAAVAALADHLLQGDTELRFKIILALNKLCEIRRNVTLDKQLIETVMLAEIMGHYRSYQILGTRAGLSDSTLAQAMNGELERIFRLMKLLFPTLDLQNAYLGIQSSDPVVHANALEFLDNTLNPQLRTCLVPLIDSEVSLQERVRLADRFLGFSVQA